MKTHPVFLLRGIGMIAVGIIPALYYVVTLGSSPSVLLLGGLAWLISVALKLSWAFGTNQIVFGVLRKKLPPQVSGPICWVYEGLLTAIFECGFPLLMALFLPVLQQAGWLNVIAFGVGFGGLEALILGTLYLRYIFSIDESSEEDMRTFELNLNNILIIPTAIVERLSTLVMHVFSCALVLMAVQQNKYMYLCIAVGYNILIDGISGWLHQEKDIVNITSASKKWLYLIPFIIIAVASVIGLLILER